MALANYTDLQASIANWIDRSDLTAVIPDFIALYETNANAELPLRSRYNSTSTTLSETSNIVALPSDFLEAKSLINQVDPKEVITPYTPTQLYTQYPNAITGRPKGFTINGSSLEIAPAPDITYSLELYYYQKVTALSVAAPTNWLLTNFPNLYLFGSLVAAESFLGTDPRIKLWGDLYDNLMQKLASSNERGQYGYAPLQVRSDAVV